MSCNRHRAQLHPSGKHCCLHTPAALQPSSVWEPCSCDQFLAAWPGGQKGAVQPPLPYKAQNAVLAASLVGGGRMHSNLYTGTLSPKSQSLPRRIQKASVCYLNGRNSRQKGAHTPSSHRFGLISLQSMRFYPLVAIAALYSHLGLFQSLTLSFRNFNISHLVALHATQRTQPHLGAGAPVFPSISWGTGKNTGHVLAFANTHPASASKD